MKKSLSGLFVVALILAMSTGCEKGLKDAQCDTYAQDLTYAATLYASSPTALNCGYYKTAIQNYLNSECAKDLSGPDRSALENKLNNLPC